MSSKTYTNFIHVNPQNFNANTLLTQIGVSQQIITQNQWYKDLNVLTTIGGIGALIISIIALAQSYQSASEQKKREKREELRNSLETLINLREDLDVRISKIDDADERVRSSIYLNNKRSIYLQSAETIASEMPSEVSSAEYIILAAENFYDSDFLHSRSFYQKAVIASKKRGISKYTKAVAHRGLAGSYYLQEPYTNVDLGRKYYQEAIDIMAGEKDLYSVFLGAFTFREWSSREIWIGITDKEYAVDKLNKACEFLEKLPDWYNLKYDELRGIARTWMQLGTHYFRDSSLQEESKKEKARKAFTRSLELLQSFDDDVNKDLRGQIYQEWSRNEFLSGDKEKGHEIFEKAKQCYTELSENYSPRLFRLNGIEKFLHYINSMLTE